MDEIIYRQLKVKYNYLFLLYSIIFNENVKMLYGSETWCLRENEMAILRRTKRAMVRAMCGAKLIEKNRTD